MKQHPCTNIIVYLVRNISSFKTITMKPKTNLKNAGLLAVAVLMAIVFAYTSSPAAAQAKTGKDTIPTKKIKDFDDAIAEVEKAEAQLKKSMNETDFTKIETELKEAMRKMEVDMVKMKEDLAKQLKDLDKQKIQLETEAALAKIKTVDAEKIKKEITESIGKIDMAKLHEEMARVKAVDMKKVEEELKQLKPELEKQMQQAREDMQKAKEEMKAFKAFTDDLQKEGLIDKAKGYEIEIKENTLLINGKEQPAEVYNRHRDFLQKHKNTSIKNKDGDFNIRKQ